MIELIQADGCVHVDNNGVNICTISGIITSDNDRDDFDKNHGRYYIRVNNILTGQVWNVSSIVNTSVKLACVDK